MKPGKDHAVYDSRGKRIATLLSRWYPDEPSLERAWKAYEKGSQHTPVTIRPSATSNIEFGEEE